MTAVEEDRQAARIDRAHDAFAFYGYIVASECIPGQEEVYADALWDGIKRIEFAIGKRRGKRAIAWLHKFMPVPCWGVEVAA